MKEKAKTTKYLNDLQAMTERLSLHNSRSFYSEAEIQAYVASHFEYVDEKKSKVVRGAGQLIDWSEKEKAVARVISHLPEYAQKLIINSGVGFMLHPTESSVGIAFSKLDGETILSNTVHSGFYDANDHLVHWAMDSSNPMLDFLHELGHAIDSAERKKYFSELPQLDITQVVDPRMLLANSGTYNLCDYIRGESLGEHLFEGDYSTDVFSSETVAELFAERTVLQWQHPDNPERADAILFEKYPHIWPTMIEDYLPFMERKANQLYAKNHPETSRTQEPATLRAGDIFHHGSLATAARKHRA